MKTSARFAAAICALLLGVLNFAPAQAAGLNVLSDADARLYADAMASAEQGDFDRMDADLDKVRDRSLEGQVRLIRLMHPTAHRATYEELTDWLDAYGDTAGADRVYALAMKRRPASAAPLKTPAFLDLTNLLRGVESVARVATGQPSRPDRSFAARDAYYSGDVERALDLAPAAGEPWVAGLAAYRLGRLAEARGYFQTVASDERADAWMRSGAAFWASRAAGEAGDVAAVRPLLTLAASWPNTFYGMVAERRLALLPVDLAQAAPAAPQARLIRASFTADQPANIKRLLKSDARARRVAALAQVGRSDAAALELRAGLAGADTAREQAAWNDLATALELQPTDTPNPLPLPAPRTPVRTTVDDYPTPELYPVGGFTLDRALVYAIVRQESRFNEFAVSHAGAMGLMQVRPSTGADAAGDDQLNVNALPLLDGPTNLRIGQDHMSWLMDRLVGYDLMRAVAAYNSGPAPVLKTVKQMGDDVDCLLLIESLPARETREYVEKVMTGYWTYQRKFGDPTTTLDALAAGARRIEVRANR